MQIRRVISYLIAIMMLMNFVDALLPRFEMWMLQGRCPIPAGTIKIFVLFLLLSSLLVLKVRLDLRQSTFIYVNLFLAYCFFEAIYFSYIYDASYVLFSFENYYFYMVLLPIFFLTKPVVPEFFWRKTIFLMTVILAGLGFVQGYTNSAIIRVASVDENFMVRSYTFFGNIRAFSLFGNSGTFGNFLCIAGAFMLLSVWRGSGALYRSVALLLFCLIVVVVTMTLSRSVYNEYALTMVSVMLIVQKDKRLIRYIPFIYGVLGLGLAFIVPAIQAAFGRTIFGIPLLDGATQQMRMIEWGNAWSLIIYSPENFFLGTGIIQSSQYAGIFNGSIDNIFLGVMLHIGVIGLIFYVMIMTNIWNICVEISRETENFFSLACICTFSTWMMLGMFTIQPTGFPLIFLFVLISSGVYRYAAHRARQAQVEAEPVPA